MCLFHSSAPGNWKDTEIGTYLTLKRLLDTRYFFLSHPLSFVCWCVVSSQIHSNRKKTNSATANTKKRKTKQFTHWVYDKCESWAIKPNHFHLIKTPSQNYFRLNLNNHPRNNPILEFVQTRCRIDFQRNERKNRENYQSSSYRIERQTF